MCAQKNTLLQANVSGNITVTGQGAKVTNGRIVTNRGVTVKVDMTEWHCRDRVGAQFVC